MRHHHRHQDSGAHAHTHTRYSDRTHSEAVVLDLGGDLGALILYTDPSLHGVEIEISACEQDDRRSHKEVLEREFNGNSVYTAVFDKVPAGRHTLWLDDVPCEREVLVTAGAVAEIDWRETSSRVVGAR